MCLDFLKQPDTQILGAVDGNRNGNAIFFQHVVTAIDASLRPAVALQDFDDYVPFMLLNIYYIRYIKV